MDGEVIGATQYIVFDILLCMGEDMTHMPFSDRISKSSACFDNESSQDDDKILIHSFQTPVKPIYPLHTCEDIWAGRLDEEYDADGIIFMKADATVTEGTDNNMFKWKPMNSVDVKFLIRDGKVIHSIGIATEINLETERIRALRKHLQCEIVPNLIGSELEDGTFKIVECTCKLIHDKCILQLLPLKIRKDKNHANGIKTFVRTITNVHENIKLSEISEALEKKKNPRISRKRTRRNENDAP